MDSFWSSICEALVCISPDLTDPASHQRSLQHAETFLRAQLLALPASLRFGVRFGLAVFRAYVLLTSSRPFQRLELSARVAMVERWGTSRLGPARQLFRAVRNLVLLGYYEAPELRPFPSPARRGAPAAEAHVQAGVLIIGSGAGGAVTAMELASCGHDVLIVEEGDPPHPERLDPGSAESVASLYRARGMTPILGRVPIGYVEGCCVGGSTELNSGFWHRPPAETLLRWKAQYDLDGASPEELCPHWQWAEGRLGVQLHDGPLPVSSQLFARGAAAMNWSVAEVPRTAARARAGQGAEAEASAAGMSRSLIPKAVASGARLMTGYRVERLEMKGARVAGAVLRPRDGREPELRVRADYVYVCAGATETPSLLRRSGLTRNVGDSLRIHPMLKVAARFNERTNAQSGSMSLLQVKEFWPDLVLGGAFFSRSHLAMVLSSNWPDNHDRMRAFDHMACYYVGVRGTGRGRVRPSRWERGRTRIKYELSAEDIWNLSRGLARLSSLLLHGGAVELFPAVAGVSPITKPVQAIRWLDDRLDGRACNLTTVHAFSSCPIGERQDRCAADSFGKVHGYENLFINDASMIPDSPGVNPQGTVMTLAHRNAQHFCDRHRA